MLSQHISGMFVISLEHNVQCSSHVTICCAYRLNITYSHMARQMYICHAHW